LLFPSCFSICNIFEELIPQKLKKGSILAFCKVTSSAKRSSGSSFFFHFTIVLSTRLKTNMQSMSILCNRRVSFKFQFFFCRHGLYPTTSNLKGFHGILYQRVFSKKLLWSTKFSYGSSFLSFHNRFSTPLKTNMQICGIVETERLPHISMFFFVAVV